MKIQVKQDHIRGGIQLDCKHCPIAIAVGEIVKTKVFVKVRKTSITVGNRTQNLPESAKDFITNFDLFREVKPFEFEIDIPAKYLKEKGD